MLKLLLCHSMPCQCVLLSVKSISKLEKGDCLIYLIQWYYCSGGCSISTSSGRAKQCSEVSETYIIYFALHAIRDCNII